MLMYLLMCYFGFLDPLNFSVSEILNLGSCERPGKLGALKKSDLGALRHLSF